MVNFLKTSKTFFFEINLIPRFLEFSICIINFEKFKENGNYQKNMTVNIYSRNFEECIFSKSICNAK